MKILFPLTLVVAGLAFAKMKDPQIYVDVPHNAQESSPDGKKAGRTATIQKKISKNKFGTMSDGDVRVYNKDKY